jgi:hypothetical protein
MDILDDLRQRILAVMPEAGPALAQVIPQARHQWGGTEPYVKKRDNLAQAAKLAGALRQGQPLREAFATAGLTRRTGFRYLNKPHR